MNDKITLKEFWNSEEKMAIHCRTQEQNNKLMQEFDKLGERWNSGDRYTYSSYWSNYKKKICYDNRNCAGNIDFYIEKNYKVFKFEDVIFENDIFEKEKSTIKKELRDLTEEEFTRWIDKNCITSCNGCLFNTINCDSNSTGCWVKHKELFSDKFLDQTIEVEVPVLNDKEKEYLKAVIKPFKVQYIWKTDCASSHEEYIVIEIYKKALDSYVSWVLPTFPEYTMYNGMKLNKRYTLEELDLWCMY